MADRAVRKTGKNSDGDITSLCDDGRRGPRGARPTQFQTSTAAPTPTTSRGVVVGRRSVS